jgi:hypothetical protein
MTKPEAACFIQAQILADEAEITNASPRMKELLTRRIEANEVALKALNEKERLPELLMQMVEKNSVATAKWAHKWADAIDRMNESFAKYEKEKE